MPGPVKKPTELKNLEGNPGKRPLPAAEPQPRLSLERCPSFIKGPARREWNRIAPELYQLGLLSRIDQAALGAYCSAYGLWYEVEQELARVRCSFKAMQKMQKKNPNIRMPSNGMVSQTTNGNWIMEPLLSVRKQALEQMHKFLVEFGMTPASRTRISGEPASKKKPRTAMEKLMEATRELVN